MAAVSIEILKYPIGKFEAPKIYTEEFLQESIETLSIFPKLLAGAVKHLNDVQLDTPYRPDGWTVRQVIHHCAESHMNCFIRIKWALTEAGPLIKPYDENLWSSLSDNVSMPINSSITLLQGLHERLTFLLSNLSLNELEKYFIHPENNKTFTIKETIACYAWHSNHHLAHITQLINRMKW